MDHNFISSTVNKTLCLKCKYNEISHTDRATCECCSNSGIMDIFTDMLMCSECIRKEKDALAAHITPEKQEARLQSSREARREGGIIR